MEGVLKIQLQNCKNLRNTDWFGASDPYVVFMNGDSLVKSSTQYESLNPVWNCDECHYLFVRRRHLVAESARYLTVSVFDKDSLRKSGKFDHIRNKDTCLGTLRLDVEPLKKPGVQTIDAKLSCKSTQNPTISFTVEFLPVETALKEMNKGVDSDDWLDHSDHLECDIRWPELALMTDSGCVEVEPVAFVDACTTGSQAWIHVNRKAHLVVVAFRGTEVAQLKDIFTDLKFWACQPTASMKSNRYAMKPTESLVAKRLFLHCGFRDAYDSIRESILRIVYDITGWSNEWTVCATGHSLGGALATICAFEFTHRQLDQNRALRKGLGVKPKVTMISFGAPKVFMEAFANLYNKTVAVSLRVINEDDPVTRIPPFFTHTGGEIVVQSTGCVDLAGQAFQKSNKPTKTTKVAVHTRGLDPATVVELNNVVTESSDESSGGLNVSSHLQPQYFENIKAAVSTFFNDAMRDRGRPIRILRARELSKSLSGLFFVS